MKVATFLTPESQVETLNSAGASGPGEAFVPM